MPTNFRYGTWWGSEWVLFPNFYRMEGNGKARREVVGGEKAGFPPFVLFWLLLLGQLPPFCCSIIFCCLVLSEFWLLREPFCSWATLPTTSVMISCMEFCWQKILLLPQLGEPNWGRDKGESISGITVGESMFARWICPRSPFIPPLGWCLKIFISSKIKKKTFFKLLNM